jgi:hypothetical protein
MAEQAAWGIGPPGYAEVLMGKSGAPAQGPREDTEFSGALGSPSLLLRVPHIPPGHERQAAITVKC